MESEGEGMNDERVHEAVKENQVVRIIRAARVIHSNKQSVLSVFDVLNMVYELAIDGIVWIEEIVLVCLGLDTIQIHRKVRPEFGALDDTIHVRRRT